jgi:hypothetical protein
MRLLLTFLLLQLNTNIALAQDCNDLRGEWINELGSVLVIDELSEDHQIIGEYKSSTGVDGKVFPLLGWVNNSDGEVVSLSFSVRWEGYTSITSWTGSCDTTDEGPRIKVLWHLVRPHQEHAWERIISNSSLFKPIR